MTTTLIMGLAIAAAAICVTWNQILVGPQAVNYPTAPYFARLLLFMWAASLSYRAFDLLEGCFLGKPEKFPPSAIPAALMLLLAQGSLLYLTLRQWLPARVWRRISQLLSLAKCGRMGALEARRKIDAAAVRPGVKVQTVEAPVVQTALTELAMSGFAVAGPNEGPQVFTDDPAFQ